MQRTILWLCVGILLLGAVVPILAQQPAAVGSTNQNAVVPPLVSFSGVLNDINNKPLTGVVGVTFALYKDQQGGTPLWLETQNVYPDKTGHYTVNLGTTTNTGLPADIFVAGEARWLGVQVAGQAEQPRVLLLSVPYALKAEDAQTVGGLPASAFVLAAPPTTGITASPKASAQPLAPGTTTVTTAGGTVNQVPLWDSTSDITSSAITQTGSGTTAKIGIGTTTPASTLDVKGGATIRGAISVQGALSLPATGTATATGGKNSQAENLVASAFNSTTSTAVNQKFQWLAEPVANNTVNATGSLNLLYASGTATPAETGLKIGPNGQITFAAGQTFPGTGTGNGSVTSVGLTAPSTEFIVTGSPVTTSGTLGLGWITAPDYNNTPNAIVKRDSSGNFSAGTINVANAYNFGGNPFAFGSYDNDSAFLGFAGNTTNTGFANTAVGYLALPAVTTGGGNAAFGDKTLYFNTTGCCNTATGHEALPVNSTANFNTANGYFSLYDNTTGSSNTAMGTMALFTNATGSNNTGVGYGADVGSGGLTNATAIGARAQVTQSNSLVLGSINGVNGATANTNVGIGTTTPTATLDVHGTGNFTGPVTFAAGQTFPGVVTSVGSGAGLTGGPITGTGTLSIATGGVTNAMLANPSLTVAAGTAMTGGGAVALGGTTTLNVDTTKVVTGVTAGTALTGGGVGGNVTLSVDTTKVVTGVTASTPLTGGGTGGAITLGLDTTKLPQLSGGNAFIGNQTVIGNLSATGVVSGSSYQIGSNLFAFGSQGNANAFLGFAGNTTMTGTANTATGAGALSSNTTGTANTASGYQALLRNTTGTYNTASGSGSLTNNTSGSNNTAHGNQALWFNNVGYSNTAVGSAALYNNGTGYQNTASGSAALLSNTTGADNTATGYQALAYNTASNNTATGYQALYANTTGRWNTAMGAAALSTNTTGSYNTAVGNAANVGAGALTNATAIGASAQVNQSNSLVLGSINGVNGATASTNVGIGTTTPAYMLDVVGTGHFAQSAANGYGVYAYDDSSGGVGVYGRGAAYSAYFPGNVYVGNLSKNSGSFKIDHPLDPANKYLYHSFVESPDMMNIYNGVVTLDSRGRATVTLPEYFEALNRDFRYQLTAIGTPGPNLYIAKEIANGRFSIAGGKPGAKVSWQVTGIRQDAYANAHRIQVEVEKPPQEQGRYLHPELFGAGPEKAIGVQPPEPSKGDPAQTASLSR